MANTVKKVTSYKELEGVKMRVGGGVANAIGTALGVAGVNAPAPKVYEIISGGVADGVMFPFETMHAFKIAELAKYSLHNPDGMYTTAFAVIMNNDSYNDLSAPHKKCIDDMRGVSLSRTIGNYWDQADEVGKASAAEYNHELTVANNDERQYEFERIVYRAGSHFIIGLFMSSFVQFVLASIIVTANPGEPLFNEQVATMTWVSFLAVFVITLSIVGKGYLGLISGVEKITGLKREDFLKT